MTLDELANAQPFASPLAVPEWTLGCFRRRSITYATGWEDTDTTVIWVQSHGLTGDIRIPRGRPANAGRKFLADCSKADLIELAKSEGFVARTSWSRGQMSWSPLAAFQPYDKWAEPGRLERVGPCLVEWAPSGIYVEDWRMLEGSTGLSVGLTLISETRLDGVEKPRTGGLVIAGDHAILVMGRRESLETGRLHEQIASAKDFRAFTKQAFDSEVAYGVRSGGAYTIKLAVDPFSEGKPLFQPDGFERGVAPDELIQHPAPHEPWSLRRWKIDTLLATQPRSAATKASPEGMAWLLAESATLLPPIS